MKMTIEGPMATKLEQLFDDIRADPEKYLSNCEPAYLVKVDGEQAGKIAESVVQAVVDLKMGVDENLLRRIVDEVVEKSARELKYLGASEKIVEYLSAWCAGMERKFEKRFDRIEALLRDVRQNTRPASGRVQANGNREVVVSGAAKAAPVEDSPGPAEPRAA